MTDPDVPDALELFRDRPNVVVLRTFSKAWALAGLRVGYLVGHPVRRPSRRRHAHPLLRQHAPRRPRRWPPWSNAEEVARRARLVVEPSETACEPDAGRRGACPCPRARRNFVWLPSGPASGQLADAMERQGVVTRPFPTGIRVTIGLPEENERFLAALEDALAEVPAAHEAWTAAALASQAP